MRVFVAGASGVVGRRLIPVLVRAGHSVVGMTRSPARTDAVRAAGAVPVVADALDKEAVMEAVLRAAPEVLVHQLTAIPPESSFRTFDRDFALTNRLRTEGVDCLLAAARSAGARRFVAQSFAGWPYAREGSLVKSEADSLDPNPPASFRRTLEAIRYLEAALAGAKELQALVLRYGVFYGPGTGLGQGGAVLTLVRRRRVPIVGLFPRRSGSATAPGPAHDALRR